MFFDTHAHLDQPDFADDLSELVNRAKNAGVAEICTIGTSAPTSQRCVEIASQFESVYAAVGIQPNYVHEAEADHWDQIVQLAKAPLAIAIGGVVALGGSVVAIGGSVVAIGETGLDRHWDFSPFEMQQDYFDRHLQLSEETGLPFIVHMRDCDADIMEMLREAHTRGPLKGVMHSFTGDAEMAAECVAMGMHISFAGMVTFKKSEELRAVAATIPSDRILIETDSPYLSPHPVRKQKRNEPANVKHTATCLAEVRNTTLEAFAAQTTANARDFFRIG